MSLNKKHVESMIFNLETVTRTDFNDGKVPPLVITAFKEKPSCYRERPTLLKDIHTLSPWKTPTIPFDLFGKPKDIVRTNPWIVQAPHEREPDELLEEVRRTRPRLVMTPAVSIDDIEDPRTRELLMENVYKTTMQEAVRESAAAFTCDAIQAPLPDNPAPSRPIKLPHLTPPYVSPEWRMQSVSWDNSQLRTYCDPQSKFWRRLKPTKCVVCDQIIDIQKRMKLIRQLKKELH